MLNQPDNAGLHDHGDREAQHAAMPGAPLSTIFTPTYNRAHTLHRVYESLQRQTSRDFEWLVIDDGSTDGTAQLVAGWTETANFPIRYVRQNHSGKHFAHNLALNEARGRLFMVVDSDDALVPQALEKLERLWREIPASERCNFFSVGGRCCDQNGAIIGADLPTEPFDADLRELFYVHHILGEKLVLALTEVMRRYPFPEIPGTHFIPEGIVWLDIAKTYKTRWTNEVLRIYYVNDPATGVRLSDQPGIGANAIGRWHYYVAFLNGHMEYFSRSPLPFLKAAAMLPAVGWFCGRPLNTALSALNDRRAKWLVLFLAPLSALIFFRSCAGKDLRTSAGSDAS